jgi:hypothetical protein
MRFESLPLLLPGALLFALAWFVSAWIDRARARTAVRCMAFAALLGLVAVPGHGEFVVAPVLAALRKGGVASAIGVFFIAVWFVIAWVVAIGLQAVRARIGGVGQSSQ